MAKCLKRPTITTTATTSTKLAKPPSTSSSSSSSSSSGSTSCGSTSSSSSGSGSTKRNNRSNNNVNKPPTLQELVCPICRSLLQEPVTLPCDPCHHLCLRCLRASLQQRKSLSCPLCRQKVSSWLRSATKTDSLVNKELWSFIQKRFAYELDFEDDFVPDKSIGKDGEIGKEHETRLELQEEEEEMRRQREKERLASEACIKKLQEEEEQKRKRQLAEDQLLAKTLAKQELENAKERRERPTRLKLNNQTLPKVVNKTTATKTKTSAADKKQNAAAVSKNKSERHASGNAKNRPTSAQKEPSETVIPQKPVPIHNAVTRVVTHQSRSSQPNNSAGSAALDELISFSSTIYGQQSEEELHVPSDVLSNKKKKLGVEVCMTTVNVEDEERIGSAESAGSHDSMNQEFHHFKPIKALPRTPSKTIDGKQIEPKLIRVLPILKRVSNAVPKAPMPSLTKKVFGCAWSAFKRIAKQQVLSKYSPFQQQEQQRLQQKQETKKTEQRKMEQSSRNPQQKSVTEEYGSAMSFDSNKNYTKNPNSKVVNGTKLNKNEQPTVESKQSSKRGKIRNGLIASAFKRKEIEVVQIDDDDVDLVDGPNRQCTPDPLGPSPNKDGPRSRPSSPKLEFAAVENIAERIKRRKAATSGDSVPSVTNLVKPAEQTKVKVKKQSTRGRKTKAKKQQQQQQQQTSSSSSSSSSSAAAAAVAPSKPTKAKPKKTVETTVTSQIKRLARAKASKRPRYAEDSEESDEEPVVKQKSPEPANSIVPEKLPPPQIAASPVTNDKPIAKLSSPSPRKRPRKNAHPSKKQKPTVVAASPDELEPDSAIDLASEALAKEQERLQRELLAEQERKDRELAEQLQARFNAMERVAGRTRRGVARLPDTVSPPLRVEAPKRPHHKHQRSAVK